MEISKSSAHLIGVIDQTLNVVQSFREALPQGENITKYITFPKVLLEKLQTNSLQPTKFLHETSTNLIPGKFWISVQPTQYSSSEILYYIFVQPETEEFFDVRGQLPEKHSLKFLKTIFETAVDGIIVIDKRGIIISVNASAGKLFGYQKDELWGNNVSMLMPQPERTMHDTYIKNYITTGEAKIIGIGREVTGQRKDGSKFPFRLSISELFVEGQIFFTGFIHDISDLKETEERLRRSEAELRRSNAELMDFAYISSHDLQEPLRKIQAFGERIKHKEADKLSEQGKDYIDRMLNASARMQKLIQDLLALSRLNTKTKTFESVSLQKILEEVLMDLEVAIERKKAKISVQPLPAIEADATQMRQLFQNLISNALKFSRQDVLPEIEISYKLVQLRAHLQGNAGDEFIEIYVKDNGIGFEEKYVDRIFNVFQKLEGSKYEGSGIGLAICKKIATRHGGDITAKSIPNEGSIFIVKLSTKQPQQK